jgi:integrase
LGLHEKGGKEHKMPCHHALAEMLHAYVALAGITEDRKGWLFPTSPRHNTTVLTEQAMLQPDAWRMIRRRAAAAGIMAPIGNHTICATGITANLGNGGALEHAQSMAAHESPRTTSSMIGRKNGSLKTKSRESDCNKTAGATALPSCSHISDLSESGEG